jgi:hypothetical protein
MSRNTKRAASELQDAPGGSGAPNSPKRRRPSIKEDNVEHVVFPFGSNPSPPDVESALKEHVPPGSGVPLYMYVNIEASRLFAFVTVNPFESLVNRIEYRRLQDCGDCVLDEFFR